MGAPAPEKSCNQLYERIFTGEKLHPVMSKDQSAEVFSRATLPLEYGMAIELGLSNLHTTGPGTAVTNELWTMAKDLAPTHAR